MKAFFILHVTIEIYVEGIVGRISPKTWTAMEVFLASIATEEYESMASALIEMGATNKDVDSKAFARDLEKIFSFTNHFLCLILLGGQIV